MYYFKNVLEYPLTHDLDYEVVGGGVVLPCVILLCSCKHHHNCIINYFQGHDQTGSRTYTPPPRTCTPRTLTPRTYTPLDTYPRDTYPQHIPP